MHKVGYLKLFTLLLLLTISQQAVAGGVVLSSLKKNTGTSTFSTDSDTTNGDGDGFTAPRTLDEGERLGLLCPSSGQRMVPLALQRVGVARRSELPTSMEFSCIEDNKARILIKDKARSYSRSDVTQNVRFQDAGLVFTAECAEGSIKVFRDSNDRKKNRARILCR